ncbi:MAG: aldose 1-epimerase [Clostridia bacterium]|nr:aldose 1-epimerase [Clostridia bacterium]
MSDLFENSVMLRAGDWEAAVLPGFGMNMVSLRCKGKPILREPADRRTLEENPHVYGIPLLFPANRTEKGEFSFNGHIYHLPLNEPQRGNHIHGLLYNAPFAVLRQTENSVTARFENMGKRYPFPFVMEITDTLTENGLQRVLKLTNNGKGEFPYTLAFHTAFAEPESFSTPIGERFLCNEFYIPTGEMTALTEQEARYCTGSPAKDVVISGFYKAEGHTARLDDIVFSVSESFDEWILFNGGGTQGFLCIEPQCGEVNGLNRAEGHRVLAPGETAEFVMEISKEAVK